MNNVISLFNYKKVLDIEYPFVVFRSNDKIKVFSLSPDIMYLGDNIYVSDLNFMHQYFKKISIIKNKTKNEILSGLILRELGIELAILCHHPFQGLLLLTSFEHNFRKGIFESESLYVKNSYQNISFKIWIDCLKLLENLFEKEKIFNNERKDFKTKVTQFERFINRLNLKYFGELKSVKFYEIQRRYKSFIGLVWKWTFPDSDNNNDLDLFSQGLYGQLTGFPWLSLKLKEIPQITNNLEFPISTWNQILPLLEIDLSKFLKFKTVLNPSRVYQFNWKITLYDMQSYSLYISFKYPISMNEESVNKFETILKQFELTFNKLESALNEKNEELQFVNTDLVVSWSIEITKALIPAHGTLDLFSSSNSTNKSKILDFGNKIESEVQLNSLTSSHIYGLDYKKISIEDNPINFLDEENSYNLFPIFIYTTPIPIELNIIKFKRFLERSSTNWWELKDSMDSIRDYYICETEDSSLIWAFRNYKGLWYKHGLFS